MSRVGELLAGVVGIVCTVLFFGLMIGGLAYQKSCVTNDGRIEKSWTFQWLAPVPYVFRPSGEGCVVHTGTRVALNAMGIGSYPKTTVETLADQTADHLSDPEAAYWARLKGDIATFIKDSNNAASLNDAASALRSAIAFSPSSLSPGPCRPNTVATELSPRGR